MPTYTWKCSYCGKSSDLTFPIDAERPKHISCSCGGIKTRRFSFTVGEIFQPHFNDAVGREVTSAHDLKSALSEASDAASLRTGNTHNFKTVDVRDTPPEALGVGEEGMRETHDRAVKEGKKDPTPKKVM